MNNLLPSKPKESKNKKTWYLTDDQVREINRQIEENESLKKEKTSNAGNQASKS
jgi:hypothetical protein